MMPSACRPRPAPRSRGTAGPRRRAGCASGRVRGGTARRSSCYIGDLPGPADGDRRHRRVPGRKRQLHARQHRRRCSRAPTYTQAFITSIQLSVITALARRGLRCAPRLGGGAAATPTACCASSWSPRRACSPSSAASCSPSRSSRRSGSTAGSRSRCSTMSASTTSRRAPGCTAWLGLALVYTYFQIPLMVIVFLPAVDGLRKEWYDASASLGGGSLVLLAPRRRADPGSRRSSAQRCCCSPTRSRPTRPRAALISQGSPLVTLQIRRAHDRAR